MERLFTRTNLHPTDFKEHQLMVPGRQKMESVQVFIKKLYDLTLSIQSA